MAWYDKIFGPLMKSEPARQSMTVGPAGSSPEQTQRLTGTAATAGYEPTPYAPLRYPRDLPRLNSEWVRRMLSDSAVTLALAARKAPLLSCQWAYEQNGKWINGVQASSPEVGDFVHRQLQRMWKRGISRLLDSGQVWGWGAGELTFRKVNNKIEIDRILVRDHEDVRPIVSEGDVVGVQFRRIKHAKNGIVNLGLPRAIWHAHNPMAGQVFGWTALAAAFSPWWDKNGEGGALDVRRLFFIKDAYRSVRLYYPGSTTKITVNGVQTDVPNSEIAMQIAEKMRTGAVYALPSDIWQDGSPKWRVEEATVASNPAHILQYPKDLDAEILNAMGIADDVLKSEATGSWAGKAVPQQATYCILEQWLNDLICDVDRPLEELVEINFGPGHQYEITTKPLAEQMLEQQNKAQPQRDGDGDGQIGEGDDPSGFDDLTGPQQPRLTRPLGQQPQRMSADPVLDVGEGRIPAADFVESVKTVIRMSGDAPHSFSSTQFNLPAELADAVRGLALSIHDDDLAEDGREMEPHVTVKYGLHTDDANDVRDAVYGEPPVAIQLGKCSIFERRDKSSQRGGSEWDVVKIEVISESIRDLNAKISERLTCTDTFPDYKPHITIAYVKPGLGEKYARTLNALEGRTATFDRLVFSNKNREHVSIPLIGAVRFSMAPHA